MDIITTARRFELTPEIREHARKRLEKLERYFEGIDEAHVVLAREKYRQIAEISLRAKGTEIISREESDDMITSIDRVVDRIERQVKRLRARRKNRKGRRTALKEMLSAEESAAESQTAEEEEYEEDFFSPVVVRSGEYYADPMTVEEAIDIMRKKDEDYILFKNARTGNVTLVHLLPDGNYGMVEAS